MFDKLRRRFVVLVMVITGLTITAIFSIAVGIGCANLKTTALHSLGALVNMDVKGDEDGIAVLPPEYNYVNGFFKIKAWYVDGKLKIDVIAKQAGVVYSPNELYEIANSAMISSSFYGDISGYKLRFYRQLDEDFRSTLVFCSTVYEQQYVSRLINISALAVIFCLLDVFIISEYLSFKFIKPAEDAWEQQSRFIADASHELKTPLTVIMANNNIMLNHQTDKENEKWLLSTKEESETMKKMLEDMLYLAKSDAKMIVNEVKKINLSETLFSCSLTFDSVAFEKAVSIETDIDQDVEVLADEKELYTVLNVLLDNAVKYSHADNVVNVSLKKVKDKACIRIVNHGEVISPKDIEHIFDRFYQTDKARTKGKGGCGLGLSIAKSAVERMKGEIICTSDEENGTCFSVTIPL